MDEDLKKNIMKTGTSLVGIVCKDGVVMASDRRATLGGQIISQKNVKKAEKINDYLVVSGTGMSSDIELMKKLIKAQLKMKELKDKKRPSIREAANLIATMSYQNIRQPAMIPFMAGLMVGGIDEDGTAKLYSVEPAGSATEVEDYDANFSSGMPYILGMLESNYKPNMSIEDGAKLAMKAIQVAIERDPASGNGIDVFTITKHGIKQVSNQKGEWKYTEQ
jgi:proteasome beta subunit